MKIKDKRYWILLLWVLIFTSFIRIVIEKKAGTVKQREVIIIDLINDKTTRDCLIESALTYNDNYNLKCRAKGVVGDDCKLSGAEELVLEKELWKNREKCHKSINNK